MGTRILGVLVAMLLICGPVLACERVCKQGPVGPQGAQGVQGEQGTPGQDYDNGKRQDPVGYGVDFMIAQTKNEKAGLEFQFRQDDRNNEQSYWVVAKINLWKK